MAGTDKTKTIADAATPAVILVKPQMGENIGACARAMTNFGLTTLRLVAPRDGWPNEKARAMASRADQVLDEAEVFPDTNAAIADRQVVYATTARRRDMVKPHMTPKEAAADLRLRISAGHRCALLFGGERAGLDNDDVVAADYLVHIPANPAFSSLNIAQAVLLLGYEWYQTGVTQQPETTADPRHAPAARADLTFFFERLEGELEVGGFLNPPEKAPAMKRNIRNMFQRLAPTDQDLRTLQGIVSALIRKRGE